MLQGYVHPDFADVARVLRKLIPKNGLGGAAVCVYHRGEKVVDAWGGTRDEGRRPWQEDTLAFSFSTTKGVASTLLHVLADRGLVDYDAPVADYWPEFAQSGKERITVRQVMCHEAGLYHIAGMVDHAREMLDWDAMCRSLAAAEPCHEPGAAHGYHGLTYGFLVGEVASRVMGKPFPELLARELATPLALDGLYCGTPADQVHRCARLLGPSWERGPESRRNEMERAVQRAAKSARGLKRLRIRFDPTQMLAALMPPGMDELDFNSDEVWTASIPAANGMFTARSLAKLYAALAGRGEVDGVRLLSPTTVERASQVQNRKAGRVIPVPMRWRLGYHRVAAWRARVPGGFGHSGFGGSGAWADPQRNLALALTVNSGVGSPFGDLRIVRMGGAAVRAADKR